jgi:hypothetical protein
MDERGAAEAKEWTGREEVEMGEGKGQKSVERRCKE